MSATEKVIVCPRCKGKGYVHGFGEGGHDPDWCPYCGGAGEWLAGPHEPVAPGATGETKGGG